MSERIPSDVARRIRLVVLDVDLDTGTAAGTQAARCLMALGELERKSRAGERPTHPARPRVRPAPGPAAASGT